MKSTARIAGHPVHPMLIPYPFTLLSAATMFDLLGRGRDRAYGHTAGHLQTAGLLGAVVAAIPGIVDYFGAVPRGTTASRDATIHAACNSSALVAFVLARAERRRDGTTSDRGLGLSLLGTALLGAGGWFGGQLVYQHHVGVDDRSPTTLGEAESGPARIPTHSADL